MSAEDFQKKQQQAQQELNIFGASMQRQFMSDIQSKLGDIAKDKMSASSSSKKPFRLAESTSPTI